jgi:hypothetical protein
LLGHAQGSGDSATLSVCHFRKPWSGWISHAMTSVARARMKDKFGAKINLHRKHDTFRVVEADGSVESGSDNPETAPTLEALLKRTKWWGFEDNNKAI